MGNLQTHGRNKFHASISSLLLEPNLLNILPRRYVIFKVIFSNFMWHAPWKTKIPRSMIAGVSDTQKSRQILQSVIPTNTMASWFWLRSDFFSGLVLWLLVPSVYSLMSRSRPLNLLYWDFLDKKLSLSLTLANSTMPKPEPCFRKVLSLFPGHASTYRRNSSVPVCWEIK